MMFQPEVKVIKTDNGFVLEWRNESLDGPRMSVSIPSTPKKTSGVEVFTDRKRLLKRIDALIHSEVVKP